MTISFPTPSGPGDTYTYESITYTWDGEKWVGSTASSFNDVTISGTSADVILQGNNSITTDQTFTFNNQGGKLVPYQQGLWTPTLNSRGADSSTPYVVVDDATYNDQFNGGWWTRIGNLVNFGGTLRLTSKGSGDGEVWIGGMPYTVPSMVANGPIPYGQGRTAMALGTISAGLTNSVNGNIFMCNMTSNSATIVGETDAQRNVRLTSWRMSLYNVDSHVVTNLERTQISNLFYITSFNGSYFTDDTTWTPINGATVS